CAWWWARRLPGPLRPSGVPVGAGELDRLHERRRGQRLLEGSPELGGQWVLALVEHRPRLHGCILAPAARDVRGEQWKPSAPLEDRRPGTLVFRPRGDRG